MTRLFLKALLSAGVMAAAALPVQAHRNWLLPSATTFSDTNAWVSFDAAESSDVFFADHRALGFNQIKVWAPDGSAGQIQNGNNGHFRTTFDVQLDKAGTWAVGMEMSRVGGTFKVNGEEWRVGRFGRPQAGGQGGPGQRMAEGAQGARGGQSGPEGPGRDGPPVKSVASVAEIPADATDVKLTENSGRNMVFVTTGAPTKTVFQPTGKGLEMVPLTHPDELVANEEGQFRYLIDGKPASGLKVVILPAGKRYIEGQDEIDLTTAADGLVKIKWPRPGVYWIGTTATDQHPSEPRASERRMSYIMTVDVLAP